MSYITDQVDELFASWNKPDSPGCSLAVIQDGEIIYKRGYGMADLERNIPLSPASVFDLGSMGKQFTATLIAILARQGALALDDSIRKYIPELPADSQPITIRHLIHHISGLRDYTTLMFFSGMRSENFYSDEEMLDLVCKQKASNYPPGDDFMYTNTNYLLLGIIAKRATAKSLPALLKEFILDPLGMKATNCNDDPGRIIKNRAIGYSATQGGFRNDMSFCGGFGDGMILSSVEDLFLWDQNFYHNQLGDGGNELIQEILTPGRLNNGEKLIYAYGLWVNPYRGLPSIQHAGGWAGYRSDIRRFPEQNFSVICLANLAHIEPWVLTVQVAEIYLADQMAARKSGDGQKTAPLNQLTSRRMESLAGLYYDQVRGEFLRLVNRDENLIGEGYGMVFPLAATGPTRLQALELPFELKIEFEESPAENCPAIQILFGKSKPREYQKLTEPSLAPAQFVDYVGVYHSEELNAPLKFLIQGEQLRFKRGYSEDDALQPVAKDLFQARDCIFQFERDEHNQVCALRLRSSWVWSVRLNRCPG